MLYEVITDKRYASTNMDVVPDFVDLAKAFGAVPSMTWRVDNPPDGTKILITTAIPNSDGISTGIFFPATNSLVRNNFV